MPDDRVYWRGRPLPETDTSHELSRFDRILGFGVIAALATAAIAFAAMA